MILIAILGFVVMSVIWYAVGFFNAKDKYDQEPKVIYKEPKNVITLVDRVTVSSFDPMLARYGEEYLEKEHLVPLKKRLLSVAWLYIDTRRIDDVRNNNIVFEARVKVIDTQGERHGNSKRKENEIQRVS